MKVRQPLWTFDDLELFPISLERPPHFYKSRTRTLYLYIYTPLLTSVSTTHLGSFNSCMTVSNMMFGKSSLVSAVLSLGKTKDSKANGTDVNKSLSKECKKPLLVRLATVNSKLKQRFQKIGNTSLRRNDPERPASATCTTAFTIPPIDLTSTDLSAVTTEVFMSLQRTFTTNPDSHSLLQLKQPAPPSKTIETDIETSSSGIAEVSVTSTKSESANSDAEQGSVIHRVSSTETALSVHAVIGSPSQHPTKHNNRELQGNFPTAQQVLQQASVPAKPVSKNTDIDSKPKDRPLPPRKMTSKDVKARQHKIAGVLQKLKIKLWRRKKLQGSGIFERCQWDIVTKIDRSVIAEIVRRAVVRQGYRNPGIRVMGTAKGSYHYVFKVKTLSVANNKIMGWVVKIPGHGTPDRWTKEDEHMLIQEVETLRLLTDHTKVPSPEVIGHSATLNNEFGFPYIVMEELPGKPATDLWFEQHGEVPSPETEAKRLTFLRSLAHHMTQLNTLSFQQIGIPTNPVPETGDFCIFDRTNLKQLPVSEYYVWHFRDRFRAVERGPFASSQAYIEHGRAEEESPLPNKEGKFSYSQLQDLGISKVLDMVFSHPVFTSASSDTFALRHDDLDAQNILIDAHGNITGILDWDGSLAMPRCVGHAAVPHFLDRDFHPDAAINSLFLSWRADHYRSVYAAALVEVGNPDAEFTAKSHIYQAAFAALYEGGDAVDFVMRIVREIPGLQMETEHLMALVGKGCKATEEMLKQKLWEVLDPKLPAEDLLHRVEKLHADAAVQAWMDGFAQYSVC